MRFEVTAPFKTAGYCHCKRCQRRSGALWTLNAIVDAERVRGSRPARTRSAAWQPGDGPAEVRSARSAAATCTATAASVVGVRLGAVDGDPGIRPQWHQWVESAPDWEPIPDDGLPRFAQRRVT